MRVIQWFMVVDRADWLDRPTTLLPIVLYLLLYGGLDSFGSHAVAGARRDGASLVAGTVKEGSDLCLDRALESELRAKPPDLDS